MDPSTLMNEGANTASFNLAEIWRFPINGGSGGESSGGGGRFAALFNANLEVSRSGGGGVAARRRREAPEDDSANGMSDRDSKRLKASGSRDENHNSKADDEVGSGEGAEQSSKPAPEPLKDYIHVRARRGQATDSHSLAERARREKISERMRILQDLVPGCNKIIGKALVLDEIINYIQSLQRQVEFLSMKLEAVNARISPAIEGYPTKDYIQQAYDASGTAYNSQAPREYVRGSSPEWLHMQVGGGFDRQSFDRQT